MGEAPRTLGGGGTRPAARGHQRQDFETDEPEIDDSWRAKLEVARLFGVQITIPKDCPRSVLAYVFGKSEVWRDRMRRTKNDLPADRTIAGQVVAWHARKERKSMRAS